MSCYWWVPVLMLVFLHQTRTCHRMPQLQSLGGFLELIYSCSYCMFSYCWVWNHLTAVRVMIRWEWQCVLRQRDRIMRKLYLRFFGCRCRTGGRYSGRSLYKTSCTVFMVRKVEIRLELWVMATKTWFVVHALTLLCGAVQYASWKHIPNPTFDNAHKWVSFCRILHGIDCKWCIPSESEVLSVSYFGDRRWTDGGLDSFMVGYNSGFFWYRNLDRFFLDYFLDYTKDDISDPNSTEMCSRCRSTDNAQICLIQCSRGRVLPRISTIDRLVQYESVW